MKICRLTIGLVLLLAVSSLNLASQDDEKPKGPFGFFAGETRAQIIGAVGRSAIKSEKGDVLQLNAAPRGNHDIDFYVLTISPKVGLVKLTAYGTDISNDAYGTGVREQFSHLAEVLTTAYGKPTDNYDFLKGGSIWKESEDYVMGLTKKDRVLADFWTGKSLPNKITGIALEARGLSTDKSFIEVGYEFIGFDEYADGKKAKDDSVY